MKKQPHKKILFDEIYSPTQEALQIKKRMRFNRIRYLAFMVLKIFGIVIVSVLGSLLLSAAVTAILQERQMLDVISEFIEKIM